MHVLKKLVVMGRSNNGDVSASKGDDGVFCYQRHERGETIDSLDSLEICGSSPPHRPPAVVTSTEFDSDEAFAMVARAMICGYEHENMSEKEAIESTLRSPEEKRAFLEALDFRYAAMNLSGEEEEEEGNDYVRATEIWEIVLRTRAIFAPTLKAMWKEASLVEEDISESSNIFASVVDEPGTVVEFEDEYYRKPPKTPKNLCLSPVKCAHTTSCNFTPSKKRRRWFFAEARSDRVGNAATVNPITNPFAHNNKSCPEIRFEFGGNISDVRPFALNNHSYSKFNLDFGNAMPLQSLQLDGLGVGMYMPPTSPIRKVSIEMEQND